MNVVETSFENTRAINIKMYLQKILQHIFFGVAWCMVIRARDKNHTVDHH